MPSFFGLASFVCVSYITLALFPFCSLGLKKQNCIFNKSTHRGRSRGTGNIGRGVIFVVLFSFLSFCSTLVLHAQFGKEEKRTISCLLSCWVLMWWQPWLVLLRVVASCCVLFCFCRSQASVCFPISLTPIVHRVVFSFVAKSITWSS